MEHQRASINKGVKHSRQKIKVNKDLQSSNEKRIGFMTSFHQNPQTNATQRWKITMATHLRKLKSLETPRAFFFFFFFFFLWVECSRRGRGFQTFPKNLFWRIAQGSHTRNISPYRPLFTSYCRLLLKPKKF
jgi:hypothetical protein